MPPKAKRYTVKIKLPILNTWRVAAEGLTKAQAEVYRETCKFEVVIEEEASK